MEILQKDDGKKGMFYINDQDSLLAEMTYVWAGQMIIIDHTDVIDELKGKNIGRQLFNKAVDFARGKGIKILPLCPFAKSLFDKNPEYADVRFQ